MAVQSEPGVTHDWLAAIRRYLVASAIGNLVWEIAQMPLYTLWRSADGRTLLTAVLHCTAGDILIATASLLTSLVLLGVAAWPLAGRWRVAGATVLLGLAYTIYSEYLNTIIRQTWAYNELMPVLPGLGTGAAPLAQWLVVPVAALWIASRRSN